MDTDYPVPSEVDRIRARVGKIVETQSGLEERETWVRVFAVSNDEPAPANTVPLPSTFAVVPDDADLDKEIVVELEALAAGSGEVLVSRRLKTGFVRGEARLARMLIHRACEGVFCADGDTCGCPGATSCATPSCVDEAVNPAALESIDDPGVLPPNSEFPGGGGTGGGLPSDGGVPDGGPSDGGVECEPPLTLCNEECVDTQTDVRYCGGCSNGCPSGFTCELGVCADLGDCRRNDTVCTGFTYCDESTGTCVRGCLDDEQCVRNQEVCELETHECVCSGGFERCAFDCVDTLSDPRFCGGCETSCAAGEVCEVGICTDLGDCRTNGIGCTGFTYCDEATGDCLRGCDDSVQCTGKNQTCDTNLHECVCAPGFHDCQGVCVSDRDVNTCGTSCVPCPSPSGGIPICLLGNCDFLCSGELTKCGSSCVDTETDARYCGSCRISCPEGEVCEGGVCFDPGDCRVNGVGCSGFTYCDSVTGACLPGCDSNTQCAGANEICNTTTHDCECVTGFHPCGGVCVSDLDPSACGAACVQCLAPPNSAPRCFLGVCEFICDDGFERCDDRCCPTSCPPGEVLFEQACAGVHVRTVDNGGDVGEYASIGLDAAGQPHIAYYAASGSSLRYSVLVAGSPWALEIPDSADAVGQHASIALDAVGRPHIAYYDATNDDLLFARRDDNGIWTLEVVYEQGKVGQFASLAFDSSDRPHIAFYNDSTKSLMLATQLAGGSWFVQTVAGGGDDNGDVGRFASLAFDSSDMPYIAFYDDDGKNLMLAIQEPLGAWDVQTVDDQGDVGQFASLALDRNGIPHISYYDADNKDLRFATELATGAWTVQTIDAQDDVGSYTSIAVGASGAVHISYFDETGVDLKHAVRKPGQSWTTATIDSGADVGLYTSIAVDMDGNAHIAYRDKSSKSLKYAIVAAPE
jgi:hypothetical protein